MKNKIYWKELPKNAVVKDEGSFFSYDGRLVYWLGKEAVEAQALLNRLAKRKQN